MAVCAVRGRRSTEGPEVSAIDFESIRNRVPLSAYCSQRGITLHRSGGVWSARCPLHQERNGRSFVVWSDRRWSCFGKCQRGGDVIDLERALGGGSVREAIERLTGTLSPVILPPAQPKAQRQHGTTWHWPRLLRDGSDQELAQLAKDRKISVEACRLAQARGILRFLDHREGVAWVVTDQIIENAVARLLGRHLWANGAKAKTLPDSRANRPIGIIEAMDFPYVVVTEGGPDTLACCHFMLECGTQDLVAPVCMASANAAFGAGDLKRLRGKSIRLAPHNDEKGRLAALRWLEQLKPVSVKIDIVDLHGLIKVDGESAKDLNDLTCLAYDSWEPVSNAIDRLMSFEMAQA
jgi:hypothetical protein